MTEPRWCATGCGLPAAEGDIYCEPCAAAPDRASWAERPGFTCPQCGGTSYHPDDLAHGYCGRCHAFTGDRAINSSIRSSPDSDYGPVLPLYLNRDEATALAVAAGLLLRLTEGMLSPNTQSLAEAIIALEEGPAGTAHLDQVLAGAEARVPILRSLATALAELGYEFDRMTSEAE
jgi:hypothetical protein